MNLDNANIIKQFDRQDALGVISGSAEQLHFEPVLENFPKYSVAIKNIVSSGMGGSCLASLILKNWLDHDYNCTIPIEVIRDYSTPSYVNEHSLVFCISVSGNTEETIASTRDALRKKANVVIITSGGKLEKIAREENLPLVVLDKISQPRYGIFMHLRVLSKVLSQFDIVDSTPFNELASVYNGVLEFSRKLTASVPTTKNPAKQLALEAAGKTPLVYSSRLFFPLAYKWKTSFNENAKNVIFCNEFPEFNHNEFTGWTSHPIEKPFCVINLRSNLDNPKINKRFELTERFLSGHRPQANNIILNGNSYIEQAICGAIMGDFSSIYLGIINGVDPTPVDLIEKFKKEL